MAKSTEYLVLLEKPYIMEKSLEGLIGHLQASIGYFEQEAIKSQLISALHDHQKLPDKKTAGLASQAIDLLYRLQQLLEPGHLVLADHFLGMQSFSVDGHYICIYLTFILL